MGSEMCIRDRKTTEYGGESQPHKSGRTDRQPSITGPQHNHASQPSTEPQFAPNNNSHLSTALHAIVPHGPQTTIALVVATRHKPLRPYQEPPCVILRKFPFTAEFNGYKQYLHLAVFTRTVSREQSYSRQIQSTVYVILECEYIRLAPLLSAQ